MNRDVIIGPAERRRFWRLVGRGSPDRCWPWLGAVDGDTYGKFVVSGVFLRAHRLAFAIGNRVDLVGKVVMHKCDNPRCCNPRHLALGDQKTNMAEASARGRTLARVGRLSPMRHEIRRLHAHGCSLTELARRFRATRQAIRGALREVAA